MKSLHIVVTTFEVNLWKFVCCSHRTTLHAELRCRAFSCTVRRFVASCFRLFCFGSMTSEAQLKRCCLLPPYPCANPLPTHFGFRSFPSGTLSGAGVLLSAERGLAGRSHLVFVRTEHGLLESGVRPHRSGDPWHLLMYIGHISQCAESEAMASALTLAVEHGYF